MTIQDTIQNVDRCYRERFIAKTKKLLEEKASGSYQFVDGSLKFDNGRAVWEQDVQTLQVKHLQWENKIDVKSAGQAFNLIMSYFTKCLNTKQGSYDQGISALEQYCNEEIGGK